MSSARLLLLVVLGSAACGGGPAAGNGAGVHPAGRGGRAGSGTSGSGGPGGFVASPAVLPAVPPPPPVAWTPCGSDLQCGSVPVPLEYRHPEAGTIELAVERRPAGSPAARLGSLVFDPGGPGASGLDAMAEVLSVLPAAVLDRFDVVAFDPRGVGRSDPLSCGPSSGGGGPLPDPVPTDPATELALIANDQAFARACAAASGPLLGHVGTVQAARDLDRIRAALGDTRLTYLGLSYGTLLGAAYASMFPTHVRAMVLDGAIDPALSTDAMTLDQAEGFEHAFDAFARWCAASAGCPRRPTGDPTSAVLALIAASRTRPAPAGSDPPVGPGAVYDALLDTLYSPSSFATLGDALASLAAGNGDAVAGLAAAYTANGSSNGAAANEAIDCLDHPVSRNLTHYPALAAADGRVAPIFGPLLAWGEMGCAVWPVPPTRTPAPAGDVGGPPVVVVGSSGDPATPLSWARSLAHQLTGGVLVTWRGTSHVALYYSGCVRRIDAAYLADLTVPTAGTVCGG